MHWYFYIPIFGIGLCLGSFLNAYLWRVREGKSVWRGRSICPHCQKQLRWYDNIPLVSFFVLKGKCRFCRRRISLQYPLVELWMGLAFFLVTYNMYHVTYDAPLVVIYYFVIWFLTAIFLYDLKYQEILDRFTLVPAGILFALAIIFQSFNPSAEFILSGVEGLGTSLSIFSFQYSVFSIQSPALSTALNMVLGVAIAAGFFLAQFLVSKGRWIGGGDIRLGVLVGVILGWQLTILALLLAYILGAIVGVYLLLAKKKKLKSEVPLGMFLSVATFVAMFWGQEIAGWYLRMIG